jgi:hypothetical protein
MTIKELKKELGISDKDIAGFFKLNIGSYRNSSAKNRYDEALCKFYDLIKTIQNENTKTKSFKLLRKIFSFKKRRYITIH